MTNRIIRVFGADPSLLAFGWSVIDYDTATNHKTVIKYGTILGKTLLKNQKDMQSKFAKRYIILWELEQFLIALLQETSPDYVACEGAYSHLYIDSYAALVMVIQTLRTAVMKTCHDDIYIIAPRESKKAVSHDGNADKISVQDAIINNPTITIRTNKQNPVEKITEHTYDAIAAGIAFIQNQLPSALASKNLIV